MKIKGIIFDLDGTLLDSCSIWEDVDKAFFAKRNIIMPSDYPDAIGHLGLDKASEYTIKRFNLLESKEDIIKEWKQGVKKAYKEDVKLKNGVKEFLNKLKELNIPFCAATANDEECYKECLIHNEIYDLFDFILEVNNFKGGKENPEIYLKCAQKMNLNPNEVVVFEDLLLALDTAKKAGFITVGVKEKTKDEEKKQKIADYYIVNFTDISNILKL